MKLAKQLFFIAVGATVIGFGTINFAVPGGLASGGVTGITLILFHEFGVNTGLSNLLINIPLLALLYRYSGKGNLFLTIYGILALSASLSFFEFIGPLMPDLTDDMILAAIGFGATVGVGFGLIIQKEGTTGGAVIVAKLLKDFWNVPITKTFLIFDATVIMVSLFSFVDLKDGIYSLVALYITVVTMGKFQEGFIVGYKVLIFSDHYEEIASYIQSTLNRGVTFIQGTGGYTKKERQVVLTIIDRKQIFALKNGVNEIDPNSFVSISHTYETLGEGFTFEQKAAVANLSSKGEETAKGRPPDGQNVE